MRSFRPHMLTVAPCRINTHLKGWHNSCKETSIRGGRTNRADLATVGLMSYLSYSFACVRMKVLYTCMIQSMRKTAWKQKEVPVQHRL